MSRPGTIISTQWFFIALLAPALYAVSNHFDKFLLSKYFKSGKVGALVLFTALFSVFALPIIYFINRQIFSIGYYSILALIINGALTVVALIFYFHALEREEASVVVPFYQTIPIFTFILGYVFLGEVLSAKEILACGLILLGTITLSLEFKKGIKIKKAVIILMFSASLLFAVTILIFKLIAIEAGFWTSAFWEFLGKVIMGILIYLFVKSYRKQFWEIMKMNKTVVLFLNSINEGIYIFADGVFYFATLLAPIALVSTLNGMQPFFVFIYGVILTVFLPKFGKEAIGKYNLLQKTFAIVLILIGTYLIREKI